MTQNIDTKPLEDVIRSRAYKILQSCNVAIPFSDFCFGGGCLTNEISDIDIFPQKGNLVCWLTETRPKLIRQTRNASTYDWKPWPIQFCNYHKETLEELVQSFDFAHIQVGAEIHRSEHGSPLVHKVYFSEAFVLANASATSWFCGSEYPLSSLIRAGKYLKKGKITYTAYTRAVVSIVSSIACRGFKDYNDFKDQLDAIDLGLLPEKLEEVDIGDLRSLFEHLKK